LGWNSISVENSFVERFWEVGRVFMMEGEKENSIYKYGDGLEVDMI
jgi:hypothetical protein